MQIGVGLAAAILIDATIIRAVLLPATMKLLGARNWYLPKSLGWLPKFEHEPVAAPARLTEPHWSVTMFAKALNSRSAMSAWPRSWTASAARASRSATPASTSQFP